ncbi:MAG TPA: hypothetical protein VGJ22_08875 [Anaerolineales bacterium]|jgi:hypothetical protein
MLVRWLVFIHVIAAFTFFLAHGASAAMAFRLRKESDLQRIRALLDLSQSTITVMGITFLVMGLTGIVMPFFIKIWDKLWVWLSIILMLFVAAWMAWFNEGAYKPLRRLVGLPYMVGGRKLAAEPPASVEAISAHIRKINTVQLVLIGYAIPMLVLWLMVFKPF